MSRHHHKFWQSLCSLLLVLGPGSIQAQQSSPNSISFGDANPTDRWNEMGKRTLRGSLKKLSWNLGNNWLSDLWHDGDWNVIVDPYSAYDGLLTNTYGRENGEAPSIGSVCVL